MGRSFYFPLLCLASTSFLLADSQGQWVQTQWVFEKSPLASSVVAGMHHLLVNGSDSQSLSDRCPTCGGAREVPCPVCGGRGYFPTTVHGQPAAYGCEQCGGVSSSHYSHSRTCMFYR